MEPVKKESRKKSFVTESAEQRYVKDSRFGIRRLFLNRQERPRISQYSEPGRTNWTSV